MVPSVCRLFGRTTFQSHLETRRQNGFDSTAYGAGLKALAVGKNPTARESPIPKKAINTQAARFQTSFSGDIFHTPYVCYLGHVDAVSGAILLLDASSQAVLDRQRRRIDGVGVKRQAKGNAERDCAKTNESPSAVIHTFTRSTCRHAASPD
jgi:hypothetical protein